MHGVIHDCLKWILVKHYGEATWQKFLTVAIADEHGDFRLFHRYDDKRTIHLIVAAAETLDKPLDVVLEVYGECFYHYAVERGFAEMLKSLGRDVKTFFNNLDFHHFFISTFVYKAEVAPSFRCEDIEDGFLLHYYSKRSGLYPLVIGNVGTDICGCTSHCIQHKRLLTLLHTANNHYMLTLTGLARECARCIYGRELQFQVISIKTELLENTNGTTHEHVTMKVTENSSSRKHIRPISTSTPTLKTNSFKFESINIEMEEFRLMHPFFVAFDENLSIVDAGYYLTTFYNDFVQSGAKFLDVFRVLHPGLAFRYDIIQTFKNMHFVVEMRSTRTDCQPLRLKGQMIQLKSNNIMLFLCSPKVGTLEEMRQSSLFISDIPLHDCTRDLVLLNQQRITEIELSKELERTTLQLQQTSKDLEIEKTKTDQLLYEMLPRQVALKLKEGKSVDAGAYESVTILFSDIVSFTTISSKSAPIDIILMLNDLYTKFDGLVQLNDVYKVETIGDAYMISSGVPIPVEDHAERMVCTGLGMLLICRDVTDPAGNPVNIRAGIHSGSVMAGVVGKKMPRYCLFGDTVNTASRMESHGVAGMLHISQATYLLVKDKPYDIRRRGEIVVKGKGAMVTYFVIKHLEKIPAEIIGLQVNFEGMDRRHAHLSNWDVDVVQKSRFQVYRNSFIDYFGPAKRYSGCTTKSVICGIM